ncbi:MAG TPA: hypothetical protein VFK48_16930 [Usitatibacter sp.]|nr:hypothetical protein [Usitatibacter sp.]
MQAKVDALERACRPQTVRDAERCGREYNGREEIGCKRRKLARSQGNSKGRARRIVPHGHAPSR